MKILILVCLYLLACPFVYAHNGTIKGRVIDEATQQPLVGAWIQVAETTLQTVTDAFGNFSLKELNEGVYTLTIHYVSYEKVVEIIKLQNNEIKELVYVLKKSILELAEITVNSSNLNLINAIDINTRPVNNAQGFLRVVPGLFIAQHAGGGKAEQIFLRGFDIDHGTDINIQVDGMPVNMVSHAHGQGYADLHFVIPELVKSVAFEKGTYYAQKGNFATAGFVEFQTAQALDKSIVKLEGGQFGNFRTMVALDLGSKASKEAGRSAYVAGEFLNSRGYFDAPQALKRLNLFGKYQHQLDKNNILTLSLATFRSSWDASGQIPERAIRSGAISRFGAIDNTEGGQTARSSLNAKLMRLLPKGGVLSNQLYVINYEFELYSNFTFFLNNPIQGDQIRQKENRNIFGYQTTYTKDVTVGKLETTSELGFNIRYDNIKNNELTNTYGRKKDIMPIVLGDVQELNVNGYLSETIQFLPTLSLNAGLRFDYFQFEYTNKLDSAYARASQNKSLLSPKLTLTYSPNTVLKLYAKGGYGFHSNDARVVTAQNGRNILPKALGFDLGGVLKPLPNVVLQIALWNLKLEQEFVYVGDAGIVEPSGKTYRQGIDFSLRYQLTKWLFLDTDLNITKPKALGVPKNENKIPLAPTFTSIGGLACQLKNGFEGSLRYRYLANRPANEDNSVIAEGYALFDAVLKYNQPTYQITLSVENIRNTKWKEAQFETESRLKNEIEPVSEIHFTPGTPFFLKVGASYFF